MVNFDYSAPQKNPFDLIDQKDFFIKDRKLIIHDYYPSIP
jgi:hypothetical protein